MNLHIGVWLMLAIHVLHLGISIALHGEDKDQKYDAGVSFLGMGLFVAWLWWVGLL